MRRHVKEELRLGVPLYKHGERPILARAGRGAQPLRDLLLDHHGDALKAARLEKRGDERRRHIVRQIGAHLPRPLAERFGTDGAKVGAQRVGEYERNVVIRAERFAEHIAQPPVQLNGRDAARGFCKLCREAADAGADLQRAVGLCDAAFGGNALRHPRGGQKVLSHGLGKTEAVALQKRRYVAVIGQIHRSTGFSSAMRSFPSSMPPTRRIVPHVSKPFLRSMARIGSLPGAVSTRTPAQQ